MRYQKKKKKIINPIQVTGIAVVSLLVIFACSWFSYSVNSSGNEPELSSEVSLSARSNTAKEADESGASSSEVSTDYTAVGGYVESSQSSTASRVTADAERVSPSPTPEVKVDIFSAEFVTQGMDKKLSQLKTLFPDGKYWTMVETGETQAESGLSQEEACLIVSDESCDHNLNGYEYCHEYDGRTLDEYSYDYNVQCLGFASMISDALFGKDADIETYYDFDDLDVGDHLRFLQYEHSAIIIEKNEDSVKVLECNADYEDCKIEWGRTLTENDLLNGEYGSFEVLKRVN